MLTSLCHSCLIFYQLITRLCVLVWVLQRNGINKIHRELDSKKLAHAIMEAEESQDMQTASWRCRNTGAASSSPSVNPKAEGGKVPGQRQSDREKKSFLTQPFILFWPSPDWARPTHFGAGQSALFSLLAQM